MREPVIRARRRRDFNYRGFIVETPGRCGGAPRGVVDLDDQFIRCGRRVRDDAEKLDVVQVPTTDGLAILVGGVAFKVSIQTPSHAPLSNLPHTSVIERQHMELSVWEFDECNRIGRQARHQAILRDAVDFDA